jgi:hypothetical protein
LAVRRFVDLVELSHLVGIRGVEHPRHEVAVDVLGVVRVHSRHEKGEGGDDAEVGHERETDVLVRARLERRQIPNRDLAARVHRIHFEGDVALGQLHPRARSGQ